MMVEKVLDSFGSFLQKISDWRDKILFLIIKPYWPRKITPNHITYLRIAIGIALFVLLFFYGIEDKTLIISLFIFGVLTDLFDGSVARGLNKVTEFGAMLDPTADRFLIIPIAVYSLYKTHWVLLIIWFLAEIINTTTSLFYKSRAPYTESNIFGKTKMVLFCIVFFAILIYWPKSPSLFFIYLLWFAIGISFLSVLSKFLYLRNNGHIGKKE